MIDNKFTFTMWVYNDIDEFTPDEIKNWVDCGMTCPMAPKTHIGKDNPSKLIPWLDKAEEYGIKLIINYEEMSFAEYQELGREGYIKSVKPVIEALKDHPACFGFCVGDEPSDNEALEASAEVLAIHKEIAPNLIPVLNNTGNITGLGSKEFGGRTLPEWMKYVREKSGCELICFDEYGQTINDGGGKDGFFQTVKSIVEAGKYAGGCDMWGCLLSSGHLVFAVQDEVGLRWQVNMAAALGLRGVMWFRFYDREFAYDLCGSPIDEYGNKTETYYGMLRVQRRFQAHYGKIFMKLSHQKTYSVTLDRGVFPMFGPGENEYITNITADDEMIVSLFKDGEGNDFLCVVNSERKHYSHFVVEYDSDRCNLVKVINNGEDLKEEMLKYRKGTEGKIDEVVLPASLHLYRIVKA